MLNQKKLSYLVLTELNKINTDHSVLVPHKLLVSQDISQHAPNLLKNFDRQFEKLVIRYTKILCYWSASEELKSDQW